MGSIAKARTCSRGRRWFLTGPIKEQNARTRYPCVVLPLSLDFMEF